jgi:hypothetical protein
LTIILATGTGPTYTLAYDDASRITRLTTNVGSSDFTYDNDNQLTAVTTTSGYATGSVVSETFSFDANGNRDSAGYSTGTDNQMLAAPLAGGYHAAYSYDHEGNRTAYTVYDANDNIVQQTGYTWDYRNRLVAVTYDDDGNYVTLPELYQYAYNAADQRVTRALIPDFYGSPETLEGFVYDGVNLALVVDGDTAPVQRYLMGAANAGISPTGTHQNEVFAEETVGGGGNVTRWALTDHQGTVRDVVSNAGTVVDTITYTAFGETASETNAGEALRLGYAGMVFDPQTGLYFAPSPCRGNIGVRVMFNSPFGWTKKGGKVSG